MTAVARVSPWAGGDQQGVHVLLWCPGCDDLHRVEVGRPGGWSWNEDVERPTINPSILVTGVQWAPEYGFHKPRHHVEPGGQVRCHSFVKDGRWQYLPDCTHDLAGQTVPCPPYPWPATEENEEE